eukprot:PLAT13632.1.p1 GENE.PLAT13632.1~~PLAT13632.1.p1  ORF type:complete len:346 (-),score=164.10 PLAT13632.1:110-1105(-)
MAAAVDTNCRFTDLPSRTVVVKDGDVAVAELRSAVVAAAKAVRAAAGEAAAVQPPCAHFFPEKDGKVKFEVMHAVTDRFDLPDDAEEGLYVRVQSPLSAVGVLRVTGDYDGLAAGFIKLRKWLATQGLEYTEETWEVYERTEAGAESTLLLQETRPAPAQFISLPERFVAAVPCRVKTRTMDVGPKLMESFPKIMAAVGPEGIAGIPMAIYHTVGEEWTDFSATVPVKAGFTLPDGYEGEVELRTLAAEEKVAMLWHFGSYDKLGESFVALRTFVRDAGLKPRHSEEIYHSDPTTIRDMSLMRTQMFITTDAGEEEASGDAAAGGEEAKEE